MDTVGIGGTEDQLEGKDVPFAGVVREQTELLEGNTWQKFRGEVAEALAETGVADEVYDRVNDGVEHCEAVGEPPGMGSVTEVKQLFMISLELLGKLNVTHHKYRMYGQLLISG